MYLWENFKIISSIVAVVYFRRDFRPFSHDIYVTPKDIVLMEDEI